MRTHKTRLARRGTALYMTVLSTALIVSLLGLTGLTLVRIERKQMTVSNDRAAARMNARSAVDLALRVIADNANWRTTYTNGVETTPQSIHANASGTLSWILEDSDGSLTDADTNLRLKGVGRVGNTVQVSSVKVELTDVGPGELRTMTSTTSQLEDFVNKNRVWCQYLKPSLPPEATAWWVTSVEFYCQRQTNNRTFDIRIFEPLPSNWPSPNIHDQVSVNSDSITTSLQWHTFGLTGQYSLSPTAGICVAVMTNSPAAPIKIAYRSGGVSETNSALIRGNPGWNSYDTDQALHYRVHGVYQTSVGAVAGTWVWDASP